MKNTTEAIKLPERVYPANWRDDIAVESVELPFEMFENEIEGGGGNKKKGDQDKIDDFQKRRLANRVLTLARE